MRRLEAESRPARRTLIVGACGEARMLADELSAHFPADYTVVGFVEDAAALTAQGDEPGIETGASCQLLGERRELSEVAQRHGIERVMVADFFSRDISGICPPVTPPETSESSARPSFHAVAKRGCDIAFSLAALGLAAPLIGLAGLAVKLTSKGPMFYCQERVGLHGPSFTIYKLRSMTERAESETGPILARNADPRSTPIGRLLRLTKFDELPQFYNVLRGDMSIIGPRPERPHFVQSYNRHIESYTQRHTVRPGITGLAQVESGYRTHVYVKLQYDLHYVQNPSLWFDLCILLRTPVSILSSIGQAAEARRPQQQRQSV